MREPSRPFLLGCVESEERARRRGRLEVDLRLPQLAEGSHPAERRVRELLLRLQEIADGGEPLAIAPAEQLDVAFGARNQSLPVLARDAIELLDALARRFDLSQHGA